MEPDRAPDMLWDTTYNIKSDDVVLVLVINQAMALVKQCVLVVNLLSHVSLSSTASSTGYNQKSILVFEKFNRASLVSVILEFSLYKIEAFLGEKFQGPNGCNWDLGFLGLVSVLSEQCCRF